MVQTTTAQDQHNINELLEVNIEITYYNTYSNNNNRVQQ